MTTPKVYCKIFGFQDNVTFENVNYFNLDVIPVSGVKQEITDVIDISTIKYDHAKVLSGDTLDLIKKCNNITLTIGTIQNSYASYFNVKTTKKKYLYMFWVVYDGVTVFTGVTNQEGIKYNESTSPDSERITIEVKSLLNHFLEYNRTKYCNITEMEDILTRTFEITTSEDRYASAYITDFFKYLFFKTDSRFAVTNSTGYAWEINRQPFFFVNSSNIYQFLTNGFRKIGAPTVLGQYETKTDFFVKLCNAMGWDFQLTSDYTNELTTLTVSNRYKPTLAISTSTDEIASINYNTEFDDSGIDYIVILDGIIKAGSSYGTPQGYPVKIITSNETFLNNGYFFKSATTGGSYTLYYYTGSEYYMVANVTSPGDILQYTKTTYVGSTRTNTITNIQNKFILFIDAGENSKGTQINMGTKVHTVDADDLGGGASDVFFRGNYGSMLFYRSGNYIKNYDDYSKTDTFRNNFKTLLKNKDSDTIEVTWNKLFTDYYNGNYSQIILNDSNTYLNTTWDITEVELDLKAEQTKMKLKRAA